MECLSGGLRNSIHMRERYRLLPYSLETIYQFATLIFSFGITWLFYRIVVEAALRRLDEAGLSAQEQARSTWVLIKDQEQMFCFALFIWAVFILGWKLAQVLRERKMLGLDVIEDDPGRRIIPEDSTKLIRAVQQLAPMAQRLLIPRAIVTALSRFGAGNSIPEVAAAADDVCDGEESKLESEMAMVRYIAWAIPSIGFIGTVRGIGMAMSEAHGAMDGDISGVTENLGVAFNSTLIALLISLALMLFVHQIQSLQEGFIQDAKDYINERLISRLHLAG